MSGQSVIQASGELRQLYQLHYRVNLRSLYGYRNEPVMCVERERDTHTDHVLVQTTIYQSAERQIVRATLDAPIHMQFGKRSLEV
ncbi:hypothetical protein MPTK1_6g11370 [Marchantia polymorpha subsp. ruderalis]|uniref:Uncharacterized protein n=2 Tax=Marchantia polymorpha TaxID=3197 RepID=A0AAF6BQW9_MARPO|nr:hypothetical protein MARPO_0016s0176 [Marchantia polymorpha]BBN14403.1 hypothetical protein Mp_6g11370 [Marchantia polymorpha subsp. ruderalis]|eukprot:PTQ45136.1 hypothetical protein MARPO_0016s0176 [Marchantia polymorpha]